MKITALLNPQLEDRQSRRASGVPRRAMPEEAHQDSIPVVLTTKSKVKDAKDAPKFDRGEPRGEVRFQPIQAETTEIQRQHEAFKIYPSGSIDAFPRHIPYKSDKKELLIKTGRDSFEVFQYTFKYHEADDLEHRVDHHQNDREWTVMWDYNIGLVRITPFFKCQNYAKTIPAKVISQNPGLKEICFSITGGALAAQGYWMPHAAAKALAATFCWKIRFALTPLFGDDFTDLCTHPDDPAYRDFTIDPEITKQCKEEMQAWRSGDSSRRKLGRAKKYTVNTSTSSDPKCQVQKLNKQARSRFEKENDHSIARSSASVVDCHNTPISRASAEHQWDAADTTSKRVEAESGRTQTSNSEPKASQESTAPPTTPSAKRKFSEIDDQRVETSTSISESESASPQKRRFGGAYTIEEIEAAYILLLIKYGDVRVSR